MQENYKKILVPVDGSEQSLEALRVANAIAKRNDAQLDVLTAQPYIPEQVTATTDIQAYEQLKGVSEQYLNKTLDAAKELVTDDANFVAITESGNPKSEIVKYAKNSGTDLIVMGATGKGALSRLLIGSTTNYVVNHAPCTVTVVK